VHNWQLHDDGGHGGLLLCHFETALSKLMRREAGAYPAMTTQQLRAHCIQLKISVAERDELQMVARPADGTVMRTVLASGATRTWIGGPAAGAGCYFSGCAVAAMMGHVTNHAGVVRTARRLVSDEELIRGLGDSVYLPFAESVVGHAFNVVDPRWLSPKHATYGSFYSGMIDAFASATKRALREVGTEVLDVLFAAELEQARREVLRWGEYPRQVHSTSMAAALMAPFATWVSWTPSCRMVSTAAVVAAEGREEASRAAAEDAAEAVETLMAYVARCAPIGIFGEQSSGMVTHYREAHKEVVERLMRLPYACWTGTADAAGAFQAAHRRRRVGWALVRLDALRCRVPKACVGAWWLTAGGCERCGAGLAAGCCVLEECGAAGVEGEEGADVHASEGVRLAGIGECEGDGSG
jgi:hypothetical protein